MNNQGVNEYGYTTKNKNQHHNFNTSSKYTWSHRVPAKASILQGCFMF